MTQPIHAEDILTQEQLDTLARATAAEDRRAAAIAWRWMIALVLIEIAAVAYVIAVLT